MESFWKKFAAAVEPSSRFMRDALAALERGVLDGVVRHSGASSGADERRLEFAAVGESIRGCTLDELGEIRVPLQLRPRRLYIELCLRP